MDAPCVAPSRVTQKIFAVLVEWYHHIVLTMSFKLVIFYIYQLLRPVLECDMNGNKRKQSQKRTQKRVCVFDTSLNLNASLRNILQTTARVFLVRLVNSLYMCIRQVHHFSNLCDILVLSDQTSLRNFDGVVFNERVEYRRSLSRYISEVMQDAGIVSSYYRMLIALETEKSYIAIASNDIISDDLVWVWHYTAIFARENFQRPTRTQRISLRMFCVNHYFCVTFEMKDNSRSFAVSLA